MADIPDRRKWLYLSPALDSRTRFYAQASRSLVGTIRCGVLFVMAFWSGPARLRFAELKQVLEAVDPGGRLELVVVDTDGCEDPNALPDFHGPLAGAGETAWIFEGRIVSTAMRPTSEALRSNTLELLSRCGTKPAVAPNRPRD